MPQENIEVPLNLETPDRQWSSADTIIVAIAATMAFVVFLNAIPGEFVYDDERQIETNVLIQEGRFFQQALLSDVWAFKGQREESWSNYWRPTFILWLIFNDRLFGVQQAFSWHVTNILLHVGVTVVAYGLLRSLGLARLASAAIVWLFAVHPVHSESVAWISGSPDPLVALPMLASLWLLASADWQPSFGRQVWAFVLYALAMGAKEIAIFFPFIVALAVFLYRNKEDRFEQRVREAIRTAIPFVAIAGVFLVVRYFVLGRVAKGASPIGWLVMLETTPSLLAFYLRQLFFPAWLGPSYPLRAVTAENIGWANFFLPSVGVTTAAWLALRFARRNKTSALGLAFFALPLLPAMYIRAFIPEQIVHDRYLYLPTLGCLMVAVPIAIETTHAVLKRNAMFAQQVVFALAVVCCVPLAVQTMRYNLAWTSNLALWEWGVRSDPNSSFNWSQYGVYLTNEKQLEEARSAFDRSLDIHPLGNAYIGRADVSLAEQRWADAEADLNQARKRLVADPRIYRRLAICFNGQGRQADAVKILRTGRDEVPHNKCALTEQLAVALYLADRKEEAVTELESVRAQVATAYEPLAPMVLFRLGRLYAELGRPADSQKAIREFLAVSAGNSAPEIQQLRARLSDSSN